MWKWRQVHTMGRDWGAKSQKHCACPGGWGCRSLSEGPRRKKKQASEPRPKTEFTPDKPFHPGFAPRPPPQLPLLPRSSGPEALPCATPLTHAPRKGQTRAAPLLKAQLWPLSQPSTAVLDPLGPSATCDPARSSGRVLPPAQEDAHDPTSPGGQGPPPGLRLRALKFPFIPADCATSPLRTRLAFLLAGGISLQRSAQSNAPQCLTRTAARRAPFLL